MNYGLVFAVEAAPGGWFCAEAASAWFDSETQGSEQAVVGTMSGSVGINTAISISL